MIMVGIDVVPDISKSQVILRMAGSAGTWIQYKLTPTSARQIADQLKKAAKQCEVINDANAAPDPR
jgi:hypothetical protein